MFAAYCPPGIDAATVCSVSGQCLMIAQPYTGQSHGAGLVYEGDHTGGQIRTAADSVLPPWQPDAIMVTNHNMIRGCKSPFGECISDAVRCVADNYPSVCFHCIGGTDGAGPAEVHGSKLSFSTLCACARCTTTTATRMYTASRQQPSVI